MGPQFAAVAFTGGSVVLAAQTPYERELLADYVRDCVRVREDVRLRLGRQTWRVERVLGDHGQVCGHCQRPLRAARCRGAQTRLVECVACALGAEPTGFDNDVAGSSSGGVR
jgi:hypothetical protein